MDIRFTCVDEVVALHEHRDVSGNDANPVVREFVVVNGDGLVARADLAADCPDAGILILRKFVAGDGRVTARSTEAHRDAVLHEMIVLEQGIAGVLGHLHAHVARLDVRTGQPEMNGAYEHCRRRAALDSDRLNRGVRSGDVEDRP